MTAGQANIFVIGKAGSTKNSGYIGYNYASAGSNNNYVTIGQWGADHLFRIYGDVITSQVSFRGSSDVRGTLFYDTDNTAYYTNPAGESKIVKLWINNGGAGGVPWSTGLNMGSGSNYWNLIQDAGVARQRNFGTGGYDWYSSGGTQLMDLDNNGSLFAAASMKAPIFYDSANTAFFVNPPAESNLAELRLNVGGLQMYRAYNNNAIWFAANNDANHALWNDYFGGPGTRPGGTVFDGIKWNAYRGLHIRGGSAGAYNCMVITNTSSNLNTHTVALYAHNDEVLKTTNSSNNGVIVQRDLYLSGSTGGNYGNQLIVGQTSQDLAYTLQDTNQRPVIAATGAYPVLHLNHTVTTNVNHGPTIQFTHNGNAGRQWLIGSSGDGEHLYIGFSNTTQGNSSWNPHNGIAGYLGTSPMTFHENGRVGIGGDWGGLGSGDPGYAIDTRGTLYNNTDVRAPIFYDALATSYYVDPGSATSINTAGTIRGNYFVGTNYATDGYTVYKGYDNWNHFISIRGHCRPGQSKTQAAILGGHQTSFVEYAESNSSTGWFFIGSGQTNYIEVAKITRSHSSFTGSVRAPLFYDTDNTGYYTDPASTSVLNALQFNYTQHGSANNIRMGNSTTMNAISSGTNNAAFGVEALGNCSSGSRNFAYGYAALFSVSSGGSNIAMGDACGYNVTSGSNNLLFGQNAGRTGYQSPYQSIAGVTSGSNQIHMGNESHSTARIQISWTVNSDARDKTDVTPINVGLDFVKDLNPVTFRWDKRSSYEDRTPTGENKLEELTLGFLAQEVEEVEKSYGYDVANKTNLVVDRDVEQDHFGITYEKMIPILTKAIQELEARVKELENN
jgi:hypothetical protein